MKNRSEHFHMKYERALEIMEEKELDKNMFVLEEKESADLPFSSTLIRQLFKEN